MRKVFPKIRYASIGQLSIAYQVWGDADNVLVYVPGIVSHLEVTLEIKGYVKWLENLSKNFKVIIFDKRGQGMSDRDASMPGLVAGSTGSRGSTSAICAQPTMEEALHRCNIHTTLVSSGMLPCPGPYFSFLLFFDYLPRLADAAFSTFAEGG